MALVYFLAAIVTLHLTLGTAQETNDVPDSFKIFETFPFAVAISDADNDTVYECLTAKRMWLEPEEKKGEYIWFLKGNLDNRKRTVSFYVFEGPSPDTFLFTVGSDEALSSEAKFHYTDYKNCAVLDLPYNGRQCMLWSTEESKDSLPQECLDEFVKHCGVAMPLYGKDLCSEDEVAEW
uniref:Lipocalin n=1 Tax=Rhipicephalus appendiculatus TaxID=34631 RepID=A0A131Z0R5_RHIAP